MEKIVDLTADHWTTDLPLQFKIQFYCHVDVDVTKDICNMVTIYIIHSVLSSVTLELQACVLCS